MIIRGTRCASRHRTRFPNHTPKLPPASFLHTSHTSVTVLPRTPHTPSPLLLSPLSSRGVSPAFLEPVRETHCGVNDQDGALPSGGVVTKKNDNKGQSVHEPTPHTLLRTRPMPPPGSFLHTSHASIPFLPYMVRTPSPLFLGVRKERGLSKPRAHLYILFGGCPPPPLLSFLPMVDGTSLGRFCPVHLSTPSRSPRHPIHHE